MNVAGARLRDALLRGRFRPPLIGSGAPVARRGDGYEFAELRAYLPGDDPRRIDWAATARAGDLQSRVMLEDVGLTLAAILDISPSMEIGRRVAPIDAGRRVLEAWFGVANSDDRCVVVDDREIFAPAALRGAAGALSAVARASRAGTRPFDLVRAIDNAGAALGRGAALLVVSDFWDIGESAAATLVAAALRLDCTALAVRDPWQDGFPLRGFVPLRDAESGQRSLLYLGRRAATRYRAASLAREGRLRAFFNDCGWRFGWLDERDPQAGLYRSFGVAA